MRELTIVEMNIVSGGAVTRQDVKDGAAFGAGAGAFAAAATGGSIVVGTALGTGYGGAAVIGYAGGEWLNENTPIQSWISTGIDKVTSMAGDDYSDGSAYC
ncbi:hypothetical protein DFP82_10587 [Psychrobacter fozii]|uniref:Uncharacterized protein n=2 Tax=Psychrobacter fozii TaxID=198480 RepID=A0A2V4UFJ0_9GAMM|nr:hypothetical protein DFP82_10587 [Psychrobacter fozii]